MNLEQCLKVVKLKENDKVRQKYLQFNLRKGKNVEICFRMGIRNGYIGTGFPSSLKYIP